MKHSHSFLKYYFKTRGSNEDVVKLAVPADILNVVFARECSGSAVFVEHLIQH